MDMCRLGFIDGIRWSCSVAIGRSCKIHKGKATCSMSTYCISGLQVKTRKKNPNIPNRNPQILLEFIRLHVHILIAQILQRQNNYILRQILNFTQAYMNSGDASTELNHQIQYQCLQIFNITKKNSRVPEHRTDFQALVCSERWQQVI